MIKSSIMTNFLRKIQNSCGHSKQKKHIYIEETEGNLTGAACEANWIRNDNNQIWKYK